MKLLLKKYIILIVLVFISAACFASDPPPPPKVTPPGTPIDSNIYILLLFAVALVLYKVCQFNKHKKTPN